MSVLIWYRKLPNTPSEKKKIINRKMQESRSPDPWLLPNPADPTGTRRELRVVWRGNVCSWIFNCFFEGGRISPSCCGAQSTVPGTSHLAPRFRRFGFLGCFFLGGCFGLFFVCFGFFFSAVLFSVEGFYIPRLKKERSRRFPARGAWARAGAARLGAPRRNRGSGHGGRTPFRGD